MPPHTIRLRAGWLWWAEGAGEETAERVDLPAEWIHNQDRALWFARSFHRPPLDPGRERLELVLGNVPGLVEVWLNGQSLARVDRAAEGPLVVPLPGLLPARNRVELRVEGPRRPDRSEDRRPWGEIALVIRAEGPARGELPAL